MSIFRTTFVIKETRLHLIVLFSLLAVNLLSCKGSSSGFAGFPPEESATLTAPGSLSATSISSSRIDLSWTDNSDNETGFRIERSNGGAYAQIATVTEDTLSYSNTGLFSQTTYSYRVCAYNAAGYSSYTASATATTQELAYVVPEDAIFVDQNHPDADNANPGTEARPFATITAALSHAGPGDTVAVKGGTYREALLNIPSGDADNKFTLMGVPGERVIVSGMEMITGWEFVSGNIWTTTLPWKPAKMFVDYKEQIIAREPNQGWWAAESAVDPGTAPVECTITDTAHLMGLDPVVDNGELFIWIYNGDVVFTVPIISLDTSTGILTILKESTNLHLSPGDRYWLQNRSGLIDMPGEWAVEEDNGQYRVYFWPESVADLDHTQAPRMANRTILLNQNNIDLNGFEITGNTNYGIQCTGSNITIRRCVVHNNGIGIYLRGSTNLHVMENIIWQNGSGMSLREITNSTIEKNEIAYNFEDGLALTFATDDILIRRNYVHHHCRMGHPDNIQIFREVTNLRFIDNLLLAGGQSIMMEQTYDGELQGNTIIASGANSLGFGYGGTCDYLIHNNTVAFSRYLPISLSNHGYDMHDNILMTGHGGWACTFADTLYDYIGDHNLYFNYYNGGPGVFATNSAWGITLSEIQAITGQDINSIYADPIFMNAPSYYMDIDALRVHECTNDTLYMAGGSVGFSVGDIIETDFDGVIRTVTAMNADSITIDPPLDEKPFRHCMVVNWGEKTDFTLDLSLMQVSPGAQLASDGNAVGSDIDIQAYQAGDFDGDGERDIPVLPFEY